MRTLCCVSFSLVVLIQMDPDLLRREVRLVLDALRWADLSVEKAALYMGISASLLRRQLDGDGHVSWTRLLLLPAAFWQAYAIALATQHGLPNWGKAAGNLQRHARMVRASLDSSQERKVGIA